MKTAPAAITVSAAKMVAIAASIALAVITANAPKITNAAPNVPAETKNKKEKIMEQHPNHLENIPRLNRIVGQIEGIKKMIEEGRYCPDIIYQLRAIRSAVKAVESNILQKHLQTCVAQSFASIEDKDKKIEELKNLFNRFDD